MKPAILETALYVSDLEEAERFYTQVLGLDVLLKVEGRHVFFRLDGSVLLIFNPEATKQASEGELSVPPHGATGHGHACFSAPGKDLEAWKARLGKAGIAIEAEVEWPNGARSIYFRDPAGNSLEFAEPKLWDL